ncbi:MAG TPA: hypothetical protein VGU19_15955 [Microvirga sp.]|jgi:hypothetical protein|nr:hypothetical protein [Microvirga sp.]
MKLALPTAAVRIALWSVRPFPADAAPFPGASLIPQAAPDLIETVQHRRGGAVRRGSVARGPRGGAVARRGTAVARPGFRPGYRPVRPLPRPVVVAPGWRRPTAYWWRPGAAVAAGAALGFVTAAAATAYVGQPPAPGDCWYYTNPQRTQGFWDVCPR